MPTEINFSEDTRQGIKDGINKVADAVKITLGPRGKFVVIEQDYGPPLLTADGARVIEEITLDNKFESLGAEVQKDIARKVSELSCDGRTAACIITQSLVNEGFKNVTAGANAVAIGRGLTLAKEAVTQYLSLQVKKPSQEQVIQVASVASGSKELGVHIASMLEEVGPDGLITVEESKVLGISEEVVKGFQIDRGYLPPYVMTKDSEIVAKDVLVLITDKHITQTEEIAPVVERVLATGVKEMVMVADDVSHEALSWLNQCKINGSFVTIIIKKPGVGDDGKNQLEDLATFTGAKIISEALGSKLPEAGLDVLGKVERFISNKQRTVLLGGAGKEVDARVEQLKNEIKNSQADFDKDKLKQRLAKLTSGIGVLRIGVATDSQKGILDKARDALNAARGAIEQGIVAGGGVSLISAIKAINKLELMGDEKVGADLLRHALEQPLRRLAINSGADEGVVLHRIKTSTENIGFNAETQEYGVVLHRIKTSTENIGFNAETQEYGDMVELGIIDSVKTVKATVDIPASAVATLLNAGAGIVKKEKI